MAALVAVCVAGCGGDSDTSAWTGTMTDSAGVTIVSNGAEGIWSDGDRWGIVELLRIGSMDGDPEYQFGLIAGIGVTSDGRMFVMDQQGQHLKVFGADGAHLATLGAAGSGPGEFAIGAGPVLVGVGDTLYVPDLQNQRVNRFAPDGSSLGSYPLSIQDGLPANWADTPSGTIVTQVRPLTFPGQEALENPMDAIITRAPDGSPIDTLFQMPSGETVDFSGGLPQFHFFVPEPTWALLGDSGLLFAVNDQYRIEQYDESGALRRVILKPFEREAVTERDQEIFVDALERIWRDSGVPPQALETLKSNISFAELFPAFFRFLAGPEGSMWVQDVVSPSQMSPEEQEGFNPLLNLGSADWEVFDPEGRFLGSVSMPPRFQPIRFVEDRVYGVWRDDLDVQHVMVLGITGIEAATATEMAPSGGE
jgi:hypothetical protein